MGLTRKLTFISVLFILFITSSSCDLFKSESEFDVKVQGTVTSAIDGSPLEGYAIIRLIKGEYWDETTGKQYAYGLVDSLGNYSLSFTSEKEGGNLKITVIAKGHSPGQSKEVRWTEDLQIINFQF